MTGFNSKKAMANDKISELINEATATAWIDRVLKAPIPMYTEEHMIKMAELVVQECLYIARYQNYDDRTEYYRCLKELSDKIKAHFGVEE